MRQGAPAHARARVVAAWQPYQPHEKVTSGRPRSANTVRIREWRSRSHVVLRFLSFSRVGSCGTPYPTISECMCVLTLMYKLAPLMRELRENTLGTCKATVESD